MEQYVVSMENPLFKAYLLYCAVLVAKMMLMSFLTGRQRFINKAFANPEDANMAKAKSVVVNQDVERTRRAHLNDIENIPIFFVISFAYLFTNPSVFATLMMFRIFVLARFVHTFVYAIYPIPQPARGIAWGAGYFVTGYMAISTIMYFRNL